MSKDATQKTDHVAAIGPYDVISGFRAWGIDCFEATTQEVALDIIDDLKKQTEKPYAIIFVTEPLLKELDAKTQERLTKGALPAIVSIPSIVNDPEAESSKIRKLTERAIGSDIFSS